MLILIILISVIKHSPETHIHHVVLQVKKQEVFSLSLFGELDRNRKPNCEHSQSRV